MLPVYVTFMEYLRSEMNQLRNRRWCVEGIFMSSRYLATVLRVTSMPSP